LAGAKEIIAAQVPQSPFFNPKPPLVTTGQVLSLSSDVSRETQFLTDLAGCLWRTVPQSSALLEWA
jgi:hypothetical protein